MEVITSPGCRRCGHTVATVKKIAADIGDGLVEWRVVDVMEELDYAVALGVRATPSIIIDGKLAITGSPSEKALRQLIARRRAVAVKKLRQRG